MATTNMQGSVGASLLAMGLLFASKLAPTGSHTILFISHAARMKWQLAVWS